MTTYTPDDPVMGDSRGTAAAWKAWAREVGVNHIEDFDMLVDTVYEFAPHPQVRLGAHKVICQGIHETSEDRDGNGTYIPFTSEAWDHRNPAGIGVTGPEMRGWYTFPSGRDAALAWLIRLAWYTQGIVPDVLKPYLHTNPRALPEAVKGTRHTLREFGNSDWRNHPTWAATDDYGQKWADTLNAHREVFASTPPAGDGTGGVTPPEGTPDMAVRFEKRIASNRIWDYGLLVGDENWFTIHENGNADSSPYDEAAFVKNGGGSESVLYHFTVGVEDGQPIIVQLLPVGYRGRHAGNATGNAVSIAVEVTQAPPGATSELTQEALRELLYMTYTHDPRIDWGPGTHAFHPDRTCGHKDWAGANPGCPQFMTRQWGGVEPVVEVVRRRLNDAPAPEPVVINIGDTLRTLVPLNLRQTPGVSEPVITTLPQGTEVVVSGRWSQVDGYGWFPVTSAAGNGVVAGGDETGPFIELVERAPEPKPDPAPDVAYPEYLNNALASHLFGSVTIEGVTYAYNPVGPVSKLWLERGKATGLYPRLTEMFTDSGHKYFVFSDGAVVVDPEGAAGPRYVETATAA